MRRAGESARGATHVQRATFLHKACTHEACHQSTHTGRNAESRPIAFNMGEGRAVHTARGAQLGALPHTCALGRTARQGGRCGRGNRARATTASTFPGAFQVVAGKEATRHASEQSSEQVAPTRVRRGTTARRERGRESYTSSLQARKDRKGKVDGPLSASSAFGEPLRGAAARGEGKPNRKQPKRNVKRRTPRAVSPWPWPPPCPRPPLSRPG